MKDTGKKPRFGVLDAVIITVLLLAVAVAAMFLNQGDRGEAVDITYTVEFRGTKDTFQGIPQIGDKVYDSVKGYYLGVIEDIRYEDTLQITFDYEEKQYKNEIVPHEINCRLTISTKGYESDRTIVTKDDNVELRVGTQMFVKSKGYANYGFIVALETQEKGE